MPPHSVHYYNNNVSSCKYNECSVGDSRKGVRLAWGFGVESIVSRHKNNVLGNVAFGALTAVTAMWRCLPTFRAKALLHLQRQEISSKQNDVCFLLAACLASFSILRWKQCVSLKYRQNSTGLHGVTPKKTGSLHVGKCYTRPQNWTFCLEIRKQAELAWDLENG
jgi:hypothetical protein